MEHVYILRAAHRGPSGQDLVTIGYYSGVSAANAGLARHLERTFDGVFIWVETLPGYFTHYHGVEETGYSITVYPVDQELRGARRQWMTHDPSTSPSN